MTMIRKSLCYVVVLCMVLTMLPVSVFADDANWLGEREKLLPQVDENYLTDYVAAGALLREAMENYQESVVCYFSVNETVSFQKLVDAIETEAFAHTGKSTDGDYLRKHATVDSSEGIYHENGSVKEYKIIFHLAYMTDPQQDAMVTEAVVQLLQGLNLDGKSDAEKVTAVYGWICENICLETLTFNKEQNDLNSTGYAVMVRRKAVSAGIAAMFYRLMLELGIDCRVVSGYGHNGFEAWNIVCLDGKYYNVDAGLEIAEGNGPGEYRYLLQGEEAYPGAGRTGEYMTEEFIAQYPMSREDYALSIAECSHVYGQHSSLGYYFHTQVCELCGDAQVEAHTYGYSWLDQQVHSIQCQACGFSEPESHTWDEGRVTVYPTPETSGIVTYTCALCSDTKTLELPKLGIGAEDIPADELLIAGDFLSPTLKWRLTEEGKLTIFGYGRMTSLSNMGQLEQPWGIFGQRVVALVVEDGVESIGAWAFAGLENLVTVRLSDSVTEIDQFAFDGCVKLESILFGIGLTHIWTDVFHNTKSLWHVMYAGTQAQWDAVEIRGDNSFLSIPMHYCCAGNEVSGGEYWTCLRCSCSHVWDQGTVTSPTCWEYGYTTYLCVRCGECYQADFTQPKDHVLESQVTVEPTFEMPGIRTYRCTLCGYSYTETISKLEQTVEQVPATSSNRDDYDYNYGWPFDVHRSALKWENGGYTRVEAIGDHLTVERYDENFRFISRRDIPLELPVFGGVYLCEDYNFVLVGQENYEEDDGVETFRIIRYTKNWERQDSDSLYGANTQIPFEAGYVRFARSGETLYIRTCHQMYKSGDGLNHQANMTICVDIPTMQITDSYVLVQYNPFGYVSHSFNQFILVDGTDILTLDHGDAYPRAVVMFRNDFSNGIEGAYSLEEINVLNIAKNTGIYQQTGVCIGGFEYSETHYLVAGNSASQGGGIDLSKGQRNIFVTATPKSDFTEDATNITWITDYDEGANVTLGNPFLIKLSDGRFFLMWSVDNRINGCYITADGRLDGDVFEIEGALSDCMPVQVGDQLVWYVTENSAPVFYSVDLQNPGQVTVPHTHSYASEIQAPTCTEPGLVIYTCTECGDCYSQELAPTGHRWSRWVVATAPTQTQAGSRYRMCLDCGEEDQQEMPMINSLEELESPHNYHVSMDETWVYTIADAGQLLITFDERTEFEDYFDILFIYDGDGHEVGGYTGRELAGVTILVPGNTVVLRLVTDGSRNEWGFKITKIEGACLHLWNAWQITTEPTESRDGEEQRVCVLCGEEETRAVIPGTPENLPESTHPYGSDSDQMWTYTIWDADALLVTFDAETHLEHDWDFLYVYDMNGNLVGAYTGDQLAGQTITVPGHMVVLWLVSDSGIEEWGFRVTDITPIFYEPHTHTYERQVYRLAGCGTPGLYLCTCTICGFMCMEELPGGDHPSTHLENRVDATCGSDGYSGDLICDACGWVVSTGQVIPATGEHSYRDTVVKEPTCDSAGEMDHTCSVCGHTYTSLLEATGHSYDTVVAEPTCTEGGYTTHTCQICGHSYIDGYTESLGHSYGSVVTDPNCTEGGYTTHTCQICGHSYVDSYTDPIDHSYVDGICERCGASKAILGDVNGDGRVNARDARALLRYIAGLTEEGEVDENAADFNGDGKINARDARAILRHIAGLE